MHVGYEMYLLEDKAAATGIPDTPVIIPAENGSHIVDDRKGLSASKWAK